MQTVHHHGRATAYAMSNRDAPGPAILFVHGSGGSKSVWRAQVRLADQHPIVRMDLSGHGESTDIDADPGWGTRSAYASDVIAVAEATDARVLVGNSLGGAVILHLVLFRQYVPDAIGLVGSGAKLAVLEDLLSWLETDFDRAIEFLHQPGHLFGSADDEVVAESKAMMRACGREVTHRDFRTCHMFDVRDEIGDIQVPMLAVVGAEDRLTPPWYHEFLANEIPTCDWTAIEEAAHLVMLERPEPFNHTLLDFLESTV